MTQTHRFSNPVQPPGPVPSGTFSNLNVLNSPVQTFSIGNKEKLVMDSVSVDTSAGDELNSDGDKLGHNTDCFDVRSSVFFFFLSLSPCFCLRLLHEV